MRPVPLLCVPLLAILTTAPSVRAADAPMAEIVVSMRYYQQTGASHAHLYLYREDGKPLRQLTDDNAVQDREPVFSPDGETIVFTRVHDKEAKEFWSVEPRGGNLHRLPAAPDWYAGTRSLPQLSQDDLLDGDIKNMDAYDKQSEALGALKIAETVPTDKQPDLSKEISLRAFARNPKRQPLDAPPLRLVFCCLHLDSTQGTTSFALDPDAKHITRLSPNYAAVYPLPGEPAFLTWTENRYVPYGDGRHTEDSIYVERWDGTLKAVRYAKPKAAGDCGGASMYRPGGRTPAVVVLRPEE